MPRGWNSWSVPVGNSVVSTIPIGTAPAIAKDTLRLLLKAELATETPQSDANGRLVVAEQNRTQCELALKVVADLISVFGRCSRTLSSPNPCLALVGEDPEEWTKLRGSGGIAVRAESCVSFVSEIPRSEELVTGLSDRIDGVSLVAEANSSGSDAGRFRDYLRLFEAAFGLPATQIEKKLAQLLPPALGYTRTEIKSWIEFRNPISHADLRASPAIALSADVRRLLPRIEQAALYVLFNKKTWRDRSAETRALWIPPAVTTGATSGMIRQGSEPTLRLEIYDEFGVFPRDLSANIGVNEDEWYCKTTVDVAT